MRRQNDAMMRHYYEAAEYKGKLKKALKKIWVMTKKKSAMDAEMKAIKKLQHELKGQLKNYQEQLKSYKFPDSPPLSSPSSTSSILHTAENNLEEVKKLKSVKESNFKKRQSSVKYSLLTYNKSHGSAKKTYKQTSPSKTFIPNSK